MWRRSRARLRPSSERATLAIRVPAWRTAWLAATRPTREARRTRDVGILSVATEANPTVGPRGVGWAHGIHSHHTLHRRRRRARARRVRRTGTPRPLQP